MLRNKASVPLPFSGGNTSKEKRCEAVLSFSRSMTLMCLVLWNLQPTKLTKKIDNRLFVIYFSKSFLNYRDD